MRILILSDIHGIPSMLERALKAGEALGYDRIAMLGDFLYHGPRNGVPSIYDPEKVIDILNGLKDKIIAVRGNCDCEVDQAVLQFPMMADYSLLEADGETFFLTHGHYWNAIHLPPIGMATVLMHGHTHMPEDRMLECGVRIFNPGSVSLPRGGSQHSFGYWDGKELKHYVI